MYQQLGLVGLIGHPFGRCLAVSPFRFFPPAPLPADRIVTAADPLRTGSVLNANFVPPLVSQCSRNREYRFENQSVHW